MTDDTKDTCPRVGCEFPYSHLIKTDEPFKQTVLDMTCARMCYIPILLDGKPAIAMIYHTYDDLAEDDGERPSEPADLSVDHETVFQLVEAVCDGKIETASKAEGAVLHGDLRHLAIDHGVEKGRVKPVVLNLLYHGFIEETANGVFKVPTEEVVS
jgi:hypothetical protein